MKAKKLQSRRRTASRYLLVALGLLVCLGWLFHPKSAFVLSGPQPDVQLTVPPEVLIGEDVKFKVTFKNVGTAVGYGPFIDLVLPAGGADLTTAGGPCDGITFVQAKMVEVNGGPLTLTHLPPSPSPTAPCTLLPTTVTHPFAASGVSSVIVPPGGQLVTLELPFGSFEPTQPDIVVEVTAHVSDHADANTPLTICARGGFRYGADPLDNPGTDPPIVSDVDLNGPIQDSTQWQACQSTSPTVFTISKKYLGPENETATGPNFPRQYEINVDIAAGQTIQNLMVVDCLPNNMVFQGLVLGATTPGFATLNLPPTCLKLEYNSVTGVAGTDVTVTFEFYIPERDANGDLILDPTNCKPAVSIDDVRAEGDWTPVDPRDPDPTHVISDVTNADHQLLDKCLAIQKSVSVVQDTGAPGPTPGDVLQYTLDFQISDFLSMGELEVEDILSDGQELITPVPPAILQVTDQFGTTVGTFVVNNDLFVTPDPDVECGGVTGGTRLRFMVSSAMQSVATIPRHAQGVLTGGHALGVPTPVPATG